MSFDPMYPSDSEVSSESDPEMGEPEVDVNVEEGLYRVLMDKIHNFAADEGLEPGDVDSAEDQDYYSEEFSLYVQRLWPRLGAMVFEFEMRSGVDLYHEVMGDWAE